MPWDCCCFLLLGGVCVSDSESRIFGLILLAIAGVNIVIFVSSPVPLIADMSSDILSRPVDVSKYAMIYGGAQKNLAPAGVAFAIIREDMLDRIVRDLPTMMSFRTHVENTIFSVYASFFSFHANGLPLNTGNPL